MTRAAAAPLFDPRDFHIADGVAHVCAAGETPFLRSHSQAIARYIRDKSSGSGGRIAQEALVEQTRTQVAHLWNVEPGDIGWVSNVAEGTSLVLESIAWRDHDEICVMSNEYPSLVAPLLARQNAHYQVRFSHPAGTQALVDAISARTRAVFVSQVSYLNGERYDLHAVRRAADAVGAMLVVDFTQASGYMPVDANVADFAFCSSYKWMLGTTGVATAFWNRRRQPRWRPSSAGWYSLAGDSTNYAAGIELRADAMRLTRGNPAHVSLYVLSNAMHYLAAHDAACIQAHVQSLTTDLLERLAHHGIASSTPAQAAQHGASVCLSRPDAKFLQHHLNERGVLAWNGRGRLRISFHGYNCRKDVDRVEDTLLATLQQQASGLV